MDAFGRYLLKQGSHDGYLLLYILALTQVNGPALLALEAEARMGRILDSGEFW
jgi:hypothetical protein